MQFSLFGAAAIEPSRADLDGLLLGGAHWVRSSSVRSSSDRSSSVRSSSDRSSSDRSISDRSSSDRSSGDRSSGDRSSSNDPGRDGDDSATAGPTGPGQDRARLSVLVRPGWRTDALVDELARRGLDGEVAQAEGGLVAVRTPFLAELVPAAERWTRGALIAPPPGLLLSAGGLRLWAVAAGRTDDVGYLLGTSSLDHPVHRAGGAQLAAAGLAAVSIGERGGPGWRITGLKRVRRLAELLGEPPSGAGRAWPG